MNNKTDEDDHNLGLTVLPAPGHLMFDMSTLHTIHKMVSYKKISLINYFYKKKNGLGSQVIVLRLHTALALSTKNQ